MPRATSDADYVAFVRAARRMTGLDLGQYRREQMERRVRALAQRRGADGMFEYLALLRRSEEERSIFRDRLTINVSHLWRNPTQWQFIADEVLPELASSMRTPRAWSAGCSNGAEPYTLAMLWREVAGPRAISIDGTDFDEASIERARRGWFSDDDVREVPADIRDRWLRREGDGWEVRGEVRRSVRCSVADILVPDERGPYDLVICRNLVIYLTPERRNDVHGLLAESLRPGGWLMVGATERISRPADLGLRAVHPFTYRKDLPEERR